MRTIWCILLSAVSVDAATYTVKAGGGGNFTTIQACANVISNGDTCAVYAGTYNEYVTLSAGGVGAYKTLQVSGTDLVYAYGFTVNSHNKITGFHIQNPPSPTSNSCVNIAANTTDLYITSNNLYACNGIREQANSVNTYIYIQNNVISYMCSTPTALAACPGIGINGNYHLIENNDISHVNTGMSILGAHNVIRKNTLHDVTTSDCDSGTYSANCHIDVVTSEPDTSRTNSAQYNLYEANVENNNFGHDGKGYLFQANVCHGQCYSSIVRYNVGSHVGSGGITDDNAFDTVDPGFSYVKAYNNTWVDYNNYPGNQLYKITNNFSNNSTHGSQINELFYYPQSLADFNPYATDASTVGTFSVGHNLAYCTASPCNLHGKLYGTGSFTDDPGNQIADPKFADYASNNFQLASGSPALGAGTYLTTVASSDSGSGTLLVVNDASFFQDGSGITGVNADCISVGTALSHVCVTAINYQTNTLTLASSITRSVDDPIWLYSDSTGRTVLIGSAPNIGATLASVPAPPTSLTAVTQ